MIYSFLAFPFARIRIQKTALMADRQNNKSMKKWPINNYSTPYLSIYLYFCLFTYLSTYLSIYLSIIDLLLHLSILHSFVKALHTCSVVWIWRFFGLVSALKIVKISFLVDIFVAIKPLSFAKKEGKKALKNMLGPAVNYLGPVVAKKWFSKPNINPCLHCLWWPQNLLFWNICMMYIKRKLSTQNNDVKRYLGSEDTKKQ